jgi:hypothetical protein
LLASSHAPDVSGAALTLRAPLTLYNFDEELADD